MHSASAPIVISIGGSIVVPKEGIDATYLTALRALLLKEIRLGRRFILVVGGGYTSRAYQHAASSIVSLATDDVDWLGIHATRMNAHLLRAVFRDVAMKRVIKDPTRPVRWREPVLIAAGWKPGWSTDYIAVRMAKKCGATRILNLTNTDAVYDKDPRTNADAKSYETISWKAFRKIVGSKWSPGGNFPFDPVASKLAERWGLEVTVADGHDLKNVQAIIDGKRMKGTVIR